MTEAAVELDGVGEVEFTRKAAQPVSVSFPKRIIELIVIPYETEATIDEAHRSYTEIVSRGAFGNLHARAGRVKVNRDHNVERTCGKALALHTSRQDGLLAEVYMSRTLLGEETLTLADEGILDASAGFGLLRDKGGRVQPDALVWETRSRRRLNKLWLGHIALVPVPAYEDARVLAVRTAADSPSDAPRAMTPNMDRWDLQQWRDKLAALDAKYL